MTALTPYQILGGESAIRNLVDRFYFYMDILPEAQNIRAMHAASLASSKDKLFKFLSGWLGGPNLFIEEYGHPMLRMRHIKFKIGENERDEWMLCMKKALAEIEMPEKFRQDIQTALHNLATHMINDEALFQIESP